MSLGGICWLSVVVCVNEYGARRAGSIPLAINDRRRVLTFSFEQTWIQATLLHHLKDVGRVSADVGHIGSDVWNCEQPRELFQNPVLVGTAILTHLLLCRLRKHRNRQEKQEQNWAQHAPDYCFFTPPLSRAV